MGAPDASPNGRRIIAQGAGNPADAAKAPSRALPPRCERARRRKGARLGDRKAARAEEHAAKAARKGRPAHASFELRDMAILPVRVVSLMP